MLPMQERLFLCEIMCQTATLDLGNNLSMEVRQSQGLKPCATSNVPQSHHLARDKVTIMECRVKGF